MQWCVLFAGMLMRALCQLLLEQQQVLLASSRHDLLRRIQLPLVQWYMLQPAADGSGLLLRWLASREQLLPPKSRDSNALGSSVGGAADSLAGEVVLLDAEQLESVRTSLAGLKGCVGSSSRGGCSGSYVCLGPPASAAAAGDSSAGGQPADAQGTEDLQVLAAGGEDHHQQQQLLLSCGLDDWVSAVLEASSATYTPPVCAAALGPPSGAGEVQAAVHPAPGLLAATHCEPGTAPPGLLQQRGSVQHQQHQQHQAPSNTGQHSAGQAQHVMAAGGGVQAPPAAAGDVGAAPQLNHHNQAQQAGAVQAGGGGGAGRGGGRAGRRTSTSSANARKLRLSKV